MENKEYYMDLALKEAKKAFDKDEVPVGCIIVSNGNVIAKSYNQKIKKNDPTSHAEIECIKKACKKLNSKYLEECEMYVTLEPCLMCAGAIIQSRIKKIYVGTCDNKGGAFKSCIDINSIKGINHKLKIEFNIKQKECSEILKTFFKNKRK